VLDRYELSEFHEYRDQLAPAMFAMESHLSKLMKRSEYAVVGPIGVEWPERVAVPFYLKLERPTAANVGRILLDFDTEVRRTTSYQLRASMALSRSSEYMTVIETKVDDALRIALAFSNELRLGLTTRPIEFLLALDWFWDFRYARSRVRSPLGRHDPHERWNKIFSSVSECTTTGYPVTAEMALSDHGSTTFSFRTEKSLQ
jgi:hypothetical protein